MRSSSGDDTSNFRKTRIRRQGQDINEHQHAVQTDGHGRSTDVDIKIKTEQDPDDHQHAVQSFVYRRSPYVDPLEMVMQIKTEQDLDDHQSGQFTDVDPLAAVMEITTILSDMHSWYQTRGDQPGAEAVQCMLGFIAKLEQIQRQAVIMVHMAERIIQKGLFPKERPVKYELELQDPILLVKQSTVNCLKSLRIGLAELERGDERGLAETMGV